MRNARSILNHLGIVCLIVAVGSGAFCLLLSQQVSARTIRSKGTALAGVVKDKVVRTSAFKGYARNSYFLRVKIPEIEQDKLMPVAYKAYCKIAVGKDIRVWLVDGNYYVDGHGSLDGLSIWPFALVCLLAVCLSFILFFAAKKGSSRKRVLTAG
jgi:hypothetical protein